ncbi:hypothetical protein B0H14DRAFT_3858738 [Mycena olivaceomarginata]|nr:hypothetical protein B0H14DRAFT_3858738 [Mycena olivaceomarginata]
MSIEAVSKDALAPTSRSGSIDRAVQGQLDIAVIGAGLVGLATSAMLRKQGHRLTIFESSSFHAEIGAGIVLPPNGSAILRKLLSELNWENLKTVDFRSMEMFHISGARMDGDDLSDGWTQYPQGYFMAHRVDLHKELMRLALDSDALTFPPASIRLGAPIKAVDFDSERPSVTTSSGEEFKFDLVLGTDGIKSTVRECMVGTDYNGPPTQLAFYRWMIDLKKNPELWDKIMAVIGYPVRGGDLINCSAAHHDTRDQTAVEWNAETPLDTFREAFEDFDDKFKPLVVAAEKPGTWQLRKLPPLPTWVKGNVALLGDAAHAMFPTYGQGFAVGLEDAGVLATLFPRGTKPSEIGARLKTFQELRKLRAERVSQMSTDAYKEPDEDAPEGSFAGWLVPEFLDHDSVAVAKDAVLKM